MKNLKTIQSKNQTKQLSKEQLSKVKGGFIIQEHIGT